MSQDGQVRQTTITAVVHHPNADKLDIATVDGNPCIIQRDSFRVGDPVVYVPVDTLVPVALDAFNHLSSRHVDKNGMHRVRAIKLRGIFSMGLVVPDTDIASLKTEKYLPPSEREPSVANGAAPTRKLRQFEKADAARKAILWSAAAIGACALVNPLLGVAAALPIAFTAWGLYEAHCKRTRPPAIAYYDIESARKYEWLFTPGEPVTAEEKLHGMHGAWVVLKGKLHSFSRTTWRTNLGDNTWVQMAKKYDLSRLPEGAILRGEIVGPGIQDLHYGAKEPELYVFDVQDFATRKYWSRDQVYGLCSRLDIPMVPMLYAGPYDAEKVGALAEGKTTLPGADHVREGIVIRPGVERHDMHFGRVIVKLVGQGYMLRKEPE